MNRKSRRAPASSKRRLSKPYVPSREQYDKLSPRYEALRDEASFMLQTAIFEKGIKIHGIESRVKEYISLVEKINSRSLHGYGEVVDTVGCRVICLFRSDIERIGAIIGDLFDVAVVDDKISDSTASFGYMSVHYVCRFPYKYNGPRYEKIAGEVLEIQVRTLCMHAWAAVSHYLDYKSETDIPDELKKGLNALSGLFYVADDQYEKLYEERQKSKNDAGSLSIDDLVLAELNLDTFTAFIRKKFSDRDSADIKSISLLLENLVNFGFKSFREINEAIVKGLPAAEAAEKSLLEKREQDKPIYFDLAMTRLSIYSAQLKFKSFEEAIARSEVPWPTPEEDEILHSVEEESDA